jgi:1,4-dihydroxy-6-naphthoate synthase
VTTRIVPFDTILDVVASGEAAAGVVIHEGQLTYAQQGLVPLVDLGAWWKGETGGPLPLGANGIRRDLPEATKRLLCRLLRESIDTGLARRGEALDYALRYARGIENDRDRADRFVGMYVNEWTRDYGDAGRRAVQELLDRGHAAGVIPERVVAEFVSG